MKKEFLQKSAACLLSAIILFSSLLLPVGAGAAQGGATPVMGVYNPDEETVFSLQSAVLSGDATVDGDAVRINGDAEMKLTISLPKEGSYQMALEYQLTDDSGRELETFIGLNGEQAASYQFPKIYQDELTADGKIERDNRGNDTKPQQKAWESYVISPVREPNNAAGETYKLPFRQGDNQLTFRFEGQKTLIRSIRLFQSETAPYKADPSQTENNESIIIEAEYPLCKSSPMLYPITDRSSVATTPYHYSQIRLNTIGGGNWQLPGQWITWEFQVKKAGYYKISTRYRQNILRGMQSARRIYIDGKVPCSEFDCYQFSYDRSWVVENLGKKDEPFYFYLEAGTHTITMETLMGDTLKLNQNLEKAVFELNQLYLEIIKITGVTPDPYRSYSLDKQIPNLKSKLQSLSTMLTQIAGEYEKKVGSVGTELSFLHELSLQLDSFVENADKIPTGLDKFKSNISTLSSLLSTISQQPLELDKIQISGSQADGMRVNGSFFENLWNGIQSFFASFFTDYNMIGSDGEASRSLTVWMATGRDQAQILKSMIDDTFTPHYGIDVKLSLIQTGLVEATMAGKGPDLAIGISGTVLGLAPAANQQGVIRSVPIDMGVRGVLCDLSEYEHFDEWKARFQETAMNGYTYRDKVFALPETQDFNMMFVRTDILSKLGLQAPETWDELTDMISILSQENMQIGVPQAALNSMLLQNGMTYYQPGYEKTVFSTQEAYEVYQDFIKIYRDYEQPYYFDAGNRFKTGELPVVIQPFSFLNTLAVLAPEINGLWDMHLVPGTPKEDGTIDHATDASGYSSMMFKKCADKDAGFAFLDWWTSADTQYRFGQEVENVLGKGGRYATANVEAFAKLNWSKKQLQQITEQRKYVHEIEEIPGSYIITRNLSNIFINVINDGANVRESLTRYGKVMDDELKRKQMEIDLLEE